MADKRDECRADENLVGQRIHQDAEIRDEIVATGDYAVEIIGNARGTEEEQGHRVAPRIGPKK